MSVRRVVPNLRGSVGDEVRDFYCGLIGFRLGMEMGSMLTFVSPENETAQVSVFGGAEHSTPDITVEVSDVDAVHAEARQRGSEIVYELRDEPWGVRRFFVRDPNGTIVNVMQHL